MRRPILISVLLVLIQALLTTANMTGTLCLGADSFIWLEGEQPTKTNVEPNLNGWGNTQFLSSENWLSLNIEKKQVDTDLPSEGALFTYLLTVNEPGSYEIWSRIGFEFVRSPFDWRIGKGNWSRVAPNQLTTDLMEIADWCEVAWLQLGTQSLETGAHTLEIRLPKTKNEKGEFNRILFACDAFCLHSGSFSPHSKFQPDETDRDARDEQASKVVFQLPNSTPIDQRVSVRLSGLWEVCRHDEQAPGKTAAPIKDLPKQPVWKAIEVPGDKNTLRPDLLFAHRLWHRTRFEIPQSMKGRSIFLVFPANNLNTTIVVNGQFCGFDKNPFARLQFDITKAVKQGVNELRVGIRDGWYGYVTDPDDPMRLRKRWNLPLRYLGSGFQELVYPVWNQKKMGIIGTPELVAAGRVYAADTFCKPSVAKKQLGVEITLINNTPGVKQVDLRLEAINDTTGNVEKRWEPQTVDVGDEPSIVDTNLDWENPRLWWPDDPICYRLRTTVLLDGKPVDVQETLFGFREWTCEGIHLRLNGVKWQGFTEHGVPGKTPEEYLASLKDPKYNYGFGRMWPQHGGRYKWLGKEPEEVLTFMDRGGALIRRTGYLDGEAAGYMPAVLPELGKNWVDHLAAWIKGERNHPSIMIWSIENELNFINARNLGQLDKWEPVLAEAWNTIRKVDPTRPVMVDGGGATREHILPVHGDHYTTKPFWNYPQLAYEANPDQPPWTWDQQRPKFIGEELFAAGINPKYAYFGGEQVFLGKMGNRPAVGKAMQIISQGYRWFGITACDFCQQPSDADGSQYNGWAPRAVLVRQWDHSFASGRVAERTVGIFNNTRLDEPLTFKWKLVVDGNEIAAHSTVHKVPPGGNEKFSVQLPIPATLNRLEGEWILTLTARGVELFRDVKLVSVLPFGEDLPTPAALARCRTDDLYVFDPAGTATAFLRARGVKFTEMQELVPPPYPGKIWLVGGNSLGEIDTSTSVFAAYAAEGGRVVLLEQENPLRYQGLQPADVEFQSNLGRTAFVEDASHPLLKGLRDKDFFTWEPGEVVYKNAYVKPKRGARSLVQCNEALANSALLTIPVNEGIITLCQLLVGEKLTSHPAANRLLLNTLEYCATYELKYLRTVAATSSSFAGVLDSINLKYSPASGPLAALDSGQIAVISSTPKNLKALADSYDKVEAFTDAGGWILLHGLTPEGLNDFNRLVGFEHMIRPFRRERVSFALPRHKLLAGLSLGDVALYSSERIFAWQSGQYVASDTFSFVVDLEDVAPFGDWGSDAWLNFVNGMVSADGWKYIQNHPAANDTYVLSLPKPQTLEAWEWDGNVLYNPTHQVELIFDGNKSTKQMFDVPANGEPARFDIKPPQTARHITIRHAKVDDILEKRQNGVQIIGCDNVAFFARRPDDFHKRVTPMLNSGGLVAYPRGKGGFVLANLVFKQTEEVPVNALKKRNILTTILRNLGAEFGEGRTVIAGAHLTCTPIDISKHATQFRTERGWFGDRRFTLKDLPVGRQQLAGVTYDIFEFRTSPVPTCIMLAGPGLPDRLPKEVRGIPVGRKADALFFLHTARINRRLRDREKKEGKQYDVVRYVIRYADGVDVELPIIGEQDIDDFKVEQPKALRGAQLAWTRPFEDTSLHAAVYSKQWNNPRPDVEITSIDVLPAKNPRGTAALLAITAVQAQ